MIAPGRYFTAALSICAILQPLKQGMSALFSELPAHPNFATTRSPQASRPTTPVPLPLPPPPHRTLIYQCHQWHRHRTIPNSRKIYTLILACGRGGVVFGVPLGGMPVARRLVARGEEVAKSQCPITGIMLTCNSRIINDFRVLRVASGRRGAADRREFPVSISTGSCDECVKKETVERSFESLIFM